MRATIDTYFVPNKTIRELHELIESGSAFDPLKDFSELARDELQIKIACERRGPAARHRPLQRNIGPRRSHAAALKPLIAR
jgi:hypothetical protein